MAEGLRLEQMLNRMGLAAAGKASDVDDIDFARLGDINETI